LFFTVFFSMILSPPSLTLFPYTTLFRSHVLHPPRGVVHPRVHAAGADRGPHVRRGRREPGRGPRGAGLSSIRGPEAFSGSRSISFRGEGRGEWGLASQQWCSWASSWPGSRGFTRTRLGPHRARLRPPAL